jgi:proteasome lid subunit RPN8/RPN11
MKAATLAATAALCLAFANARAAELATAILPASAPSFATVGEAARAGLLSAAARSTGYEFGGVVLRCAGAYRYTSPVTAHNPRSIAFAVRVPKGCTLAALYHTHPGEYVNASRFSQADVQTAQALHVPSYIVTVATGAVRVFDPSTMRAHLNGQHMEEGATADGRLVAVLGPTREK